MECHKLNWKLYGTILLECRELDWNLVALCDMFGIFLAIHYIMVKSILFILKPNHNQSFSYKRKLFYFHSSYQNIQRPTYLFQTSNYNDIQPIRVMSSYDYNYTISK